MQDNDNIVLEERKIGFAGNVNFVPYYTNSSWNATDDAFYFFTMPCDDVTPTVSHCAAPLRRRCITYSVAFGS